MSIMPSIRFLVCLIALASPCLVAIVPNARAQDEPKAEETFQPDRRRDGGFRRDQIQTDDARSNEGTEEGMPRFRRQADEQALWPRWPPGRPRWRLGVFAYNTDTGVVVTRVVPGSAAWRLRLEPGDRIVAVAGFQIGWVDHRLFPLSTELQLHAGHRGRVTLLLQNIRNQQLLTRNVQLDRIGAGGPWPLRERPR